MVATFSTGQLIVGNMLVIFVGNDNWYTVVSALLHWLMIMFPILQMGQRDPRASIDVSASYYISWTWKHKAFNFKPKLFYGWFKAQVAKISTKRNLRYERYRLVWEGILFEFNWTKGNKVRDFSLLSIFHCALSLHRLNWVIHFWKHNFCWKKTVLYQPAHSRWID